MTSIFDPKYEPNREQRLTIRFELARYLGRRELSRYLGIMGRCTECVYWEAEERWCNIYNERCCGAGCLEGDE